MPKLTEGTYLYFDFSKYGGLVVTIYTTVLGAPTRITAFVDTDLTKFYDWLFERQSIEPMTVEHFTAALTGLQDAACKLWQITTSQFISRPWDRTGEL